MNRLINRSKGPALEYSEYAMSFYEGCTDTPCDYCFMKSMSNRFKTYFGPARLKPWLINEDNAIHVFLKEMHKNLPELQKIGLFFNFSSDPGLERAFELNQKVWMFCVLNQIPVKVLTKQTDWVDEFLRKPFWKEHQLISIGFTLTGHDELEKGSAPNMQRIYAMNRLDKAGFKTFGSFEPAIDLYVTYQMILHAKDCCDLFKIGLQSGKKYDKNELLKFMLQVHSAIQDKFIYWKDSLLKQAGINREDLPSNCVDRTFNL
jgi:DNA repair photolyase